MLLPLLLTCAAAVGSSPGASVSGEDPFTRGEVRELVLARRPGQVEEYFRLDLSPAAGGADEVARGQGPVGLARWTRGPLSAETGGWRTALYYQYYEFPGAHSVRRHYGVRTDRYKLIHFYNLDEWELFDLDKDPNELQSVYDHPEYAPVVARMKKELGRLRALYQVPAPAHSRAAL